MDVSFHHTAPEPSLQPLLDQLPWFFFYAGAMSFVFACIAIGIFRYVLASWLPDSFAMLKTAYMDRKDAKDMKNAPDLSNSGVRASSKRCAA